MVNIDSGHSFTAYFKRAVSPLMVLALLKNKSMYGYEINSEISRRSGGRLKISVLYPVLYKLEEREMIRVSDTVIENGRARNYYSITDDGLAYYNKTSKEFLELASLFEKFVKEEGGSDEKQGR